MREVLAAAIHIDVGADLPSAGVDLHARARVGELVVVHLVAPPWLQRRLLVGVPGLPREAHEHQHDAEVNDVPAIAPARRRRQREDRVHEPRQASQPPENRRSRCARPALRARPEEERELLNDDCQIENAERNAHDGRMRVEYAQQGAEHARVDRLAVDHRGEAERRADGELEHDSESERAERDDARAAAQRHRGSSSSSRASPRP